MYKEHVIQIAVGIDEETIKASALNQMVKEINSGISDAYFEKIITDT